MLRTYEDIAKKLGMTRSGVRKLEQRALRKARKILARKGYTFEDLLPTQTHFEPERTPWDTSE